MGSGKLLVAFKRALKSAQFVVVGTVYAVIASEPLSDQKLV